jgi:hypothetical protein
VVRVEGVVPLAAEIGVRDVEAGHFVVGEGQAFEIGVGVEFADAFNPVSVVVEAIRSRMTW